MLSKFNLYDRKGNISVGKIYNLVVLIESFILLGTSLYGVFKFNIDEPIIAMTLIVGVYINIYLLFFSISSLKREDSFQMALSALTHIFLTVISSIHYWNQPVGDPFNTPLLIIFITSALCQIIFIVLTPLVLRSFGGYIFEQVGGDIQLQKMYCLGLIFFALLKFDAFLSFLSLLLASARLIEHFLAKENIMNVCSCVYNLVWTILGYWVVKDEMIKSLYVWLVFGFIGQPIYISYKGYQLWSSGFYNDDLYPKDAKILFMVVGGMYLLCHMALILFTIIKIRGIFGHGLIPIWKDSLRASKRDEDDAKKIAQQKQIDDLRANALLNKNKNLYGSGFYRGQQDHQGQQQQQQQQQQQSPQQPQNTVPYQLSDQYDDNNNNYQNVDKKKKNKKDQNIDNMKQPLLSGTNDSVNRDDGTDDVFIDVNTPTGGDGTPSTDNNNNQNNNNQNNNNNNTSPTATHQTNSLNISHATLEHMQNNSMLNMNVTKGKKYRR